MGDITDADCYYFEDATSADTDYLMIEFSTHCQSVEGYMRGAGAHRIQLSIACFVSIFKSSSRKQPDEPFHNFGVSKSVDQLILCTYT